MADDPKEVIEIFNKCELFFKEALDGAAERSGIRVSQELGFYLLGLMGAGMKLEPYSDKMGLGFRLIEAEVADDIKGYKHVGDTSLIIAGIWWQSLIKKMVDVDYYINIGSRSFKRASESEISQFRSDLFAELSRNFENAVILLTEASQFISSSSFNNQDIVRIYEDWLRTNHPIFATKLRSLGIHVTPGKKTKQ